MISFSGFISRLWEKSFSSWRVGLVGCVLLAPACSHCLHSPPVLLQTRDLPHQRMLLKAGQHLVNATQKKNVGAKSRQSHPGRWRRRWWSSSSSSSSPLAQWPRDLSVSLVWCLVLSFMHVFTHTHAHAFFLKANTITPPTLH